MRLYLRDDCNKSTQARFNSLTFRNIHICIYISFDIKRLFLRNGKIVSSPCYLGSKERQNLFIIRTCISNSLPPPVRVTRHNKAFFEFLQPSRVELAVIYLEDKWGIRKEIEARHSSKDDLKARDETRDASQFPPWEELVARQVRGIHRKELAS